MASSPVLSCVSASVSVIVSVHEAKSNPKGGGRDLLGGGELHEHLPDHGRVHTLFPGPHDQEALDLPKVLLALLDRVLPCKKLS